MSPLDLRPFDMVDYIRDEEFLRATIEDGLPSLIEEARRIVERSRQLQEDWHATGTKNHDHDAGRDESGL